MTVVRCVIVDCTNTKKNSDCKFYQFPRPWWKRDQRNMWITAVKRKNPDGSPWQPKPDDRICSAHFIGGRKSDEEASPSYVPKLFPPIYKSKRIDENAEMLRFQRYMKRRTTRTVEAEAVHPNNSSVLELLENSVNLKVETECQVDLYFSKNIQNPGQTFTCNRYIFYGKETCDAEVQTEIDINTNTIKAFKMMRHRGCNTAKSISMDQATITVNKYFAGFQSINTNEQLLHRFCSGCSMSTGTEEGVSVKVEPLSDDEPRSDLQELYRDHQIKEELVLGPELMTKPTKAEVAGNRQPNRMRFASVMVRDPIVSLPRTLQSRHSNKAPGPDPLAGSDEPLLNSKQNKLSTEQLTSPSDQNKYYCQYCNRAFRYKKMQTKHERTHTNVDHAYHCEKCEKTFKVSESLREHVKRMHGNRKPYGCKMCTKRFRRKRLLVDHMSVHASLKPFECDSCHSKFWNKSFLARHIHSAHRAWKIVRYAAGNFSLTPITWRV